MARDSSIYLELVLSILHSRGAIRGGSNPPLVNQMKANLFSHYSRIPFLKLLSS